MSYGIIKEHNGEIFLDSSYTEGTKFTLLFPIFAGEDTHEQKTAVKNLLSSTTRVLIIDDESDIIEFQKDVLKIYTCITEVAYDSEQTLNKIKKNFYDIILSNIKMPDKLDGRGYCQQGDARVFGKYR